MRVSEWVSERERERERGRILYSALDCNILPNCNCITAWNFNIVILEMASLKYDMVLRIILSNMHQEPHIDRGQMDGLGMEKDRLVPTH